MACQKCGSERLLNVNAKTSDMCCTRFAGEHKDGYTPSGINIGGGDYLRFELCLECGQVQGKWPVVYPEPSDDEE